MNRNTIKEIQRICKGKKNLICELHNKKTGKFVIAIPTNPEKDIDYVYIYSKYTPNFETSTMKGFEEGMRLFYSESEEESNKKMGLRNKTKAGSKKKDSVNLQLGMINVSDKRVLIEDKDKDFKEGMKNFKKEMWLSTQSKSKIKKENEKIKSKNSAGSKAKAGTYNPLRSGVIRSGSKAKLKKKSETEEYGTGSRIEETEKERFNIESDNINERFLDLLKKVRALGQEEITVKKNLDQRKAKLIETIYNGLKQDFNKFKGRWQSKYNIAELDRRFIRLSNDTLPYLRKPTKKKK